ncbi:cytochrome o ubiquinol oxidase subunit IV [Methylobacterium sp. JK268]
MSQVHHDARNEADLAPGDELAEEETGGGLRSYLIGLGLATLLTAASFAVLKAHFLWAPAIPIALFVFAIAQMGVHLVFFLHITTGPDNTNNVMALGFGVLIVLLLFGGSVWIMHHMNSNMMPEPGMGGSMTMPMPHGAHGSP